MVQHKWQLCDCEIKFTILLLLTYMHYNDMKFATRTSLVYPFQSQWLSLVYINSFYSFL